MTFGLSRSGFHIEAGSLEVQTASSRPFVARSGTITGRARVAQGNAAKAGCAAPAPGSTEIAKAISNKGRIGEIAFDRCDRARS